MIWNHLWRLLGPAEVLGPTDWECRNSICSNLSFCSFTLFLNLACPLKILFLPSQMEDIKALVSLGGGFLPKGTIILFLTLFLWGSLWRNVLCQYGKCPYHIKATIICTRDTRCGNVDLVIWWKDFVWQKISAQASDKDQMRILRTPSALEIGNHLLPEGSVQISRVMPGHQAVYNLQYRSVKRCGVI